MWMELLDEKNQMKKSINNVIRKAKTLLKIEM
jgi:hypothetical protein